MMNEASPEQFSPKPTSMQKDYLYLVANTYLQNNHFNKAITIFDLILELFENDAHATVSKGFSQMKLGNYDDAKATVEQIDESSLDMRHKAILFLILGRANQFLGFKKESESYTLRYTKIRNELKKDTLAGAQYEL